MSQDSATPDQIDTVAHVVEAYREFLSRMQRLSVQEKKLVRETIEKIDQEKIAQLENRIHSSER